MIRREHPDTLVIVDAADLGEAPGSVRVIPASRIEDTGIGTHMLPLHHLLAYLKPVVGEIFVIGIQPAIVTSGETLSPAVERAVARLAEQLASDEWRKIPWLDDRPPRATDA